MAASYAFVVRGRVQGVSFRYAALQEARRLGLRGWVRNRMDGVVEGLAGGEPAALDAFHAWLRRGPPAARVESVEWHDAAGAPDGQSFEVRR